MLVRVLIIIVTLSFEFLHNNQSTSDRRSLGFIDKLYFSPCGHPDLLILKMATNVKASTIKLQSAYEKMEKATYKVRYLSSCLKSQILPKGMRIRFTLACEPDKDLHDKIQEALNVASYSIFTAVLSFSERKLEELQDAWVKIRSELEEKMGMFWCDRLVGKVKKASQCELKKIVESHNIKLTVLEKEKNFSKNNVNLPRKGSCRISSDSLIVPTGEIYLSHPERKNKNKRMEKCRDDRNKRKTRRGGKKHKIRNRNRNNVERKWSPSEEDVKQFDPIILAENVKLTDEQVSLCRMSDKFIPTPKTPIDVSDQMIGTHKWAENLRWFRYFKMKEFELGEMEVDEFQKMPWHVPTDKRAPRGDKCLEQFIEQCTTDFLSVQGRNRIRDNLTQEQRIALTDLRRLPLTDNCACRFADKSGVTVITSLTDDDTRIKVDLRDTKHFDILKNDNTDDIRMIVTKFADKWYKKGAIDNKVKAYIVDVKNSNPAKCKPLIKTHKAAPYPHRLLLSGSGTPTQNLSKFIQLSISHLAERLPYQILDTKEFLKKIDDINRFKTPLPATTTLATCDVISLYPSVDNKMGVPAVRKMLKKHPSPLGVPSNCIIEGLNIALNYNTCAYEDGEGKVTVAAPNNGTAMGPAHAPTYVDVFMGVLDEKLVENSPVPLLSSTKSKENNGTEKRPEWSRYRDDGFVILTNEKDVNTFEKYLQTLHPEKIKWTMNFGKSVEYLDVKVHINEDGKLSTDVFSKNIHNYLPPTSCHPKSVFKGMLIGMGRRLRMICSEDQILEKRLLEYTRYLVMSGWDWNRAYEGLKQGASVPRKQILHTDKTEKTKDKNSKKKIAWVTRHDPRVPNKSKIIQKNIHLLHKNPVNVRIFPKNMIIAADRKGRNLGELYKPTIPKRTVVYGPQNRNGFFKCTRKCDMCAHSQETTDFVSSWDQRRWNIRRHLTCSTPNIIYKLHCKYHPDFLYVGSTINVKRRWANHKSDCKLKKNSKCRVATHVNNLNHPSDPELQFLVIVPIEHVVDTENLLEREFYWQANLGTLQPGGNERIDIGTILKSRIQF